MTPCVRGEGPVRVLLIQPPHIGEKIVRPPNFLPLNLGYLASVLRRGGVDVSVLDIWGRNLSFPEVERILASGGYDIYGITALSTQFNYVEKLASAISSIDTSPIVMGGALATFSYEEVLTAMEVDYCVLGEGEETVLDLFQAISSGTDLSRIRGIAYRADGETVLTEPREAVGDLDSIPLPAYDLFNMETYTSSCCVYSKYGRYDHLPAINVLTGRGCPFNCHFCSKTIQGVRHRSIDSVVDEIRMLVDRYGIRGVFFNDEMVVGPKRRAYELSEKIGPLGLKWSCQGRSNLMDRDLLRAMKAAGCVSVGYGVESGSQKILDAMNKRQSLEDVVEAINMTVAEGMEPIPQWMFGYPGEDDETVRETRSTFSRFDFPVNPVFVCTPLPGTKLYRDTINDGKIPDTIAFHRRLSDGYASGGETLVNFTGWSDVEFARRMRGLEVSVRMDFFRRALVKPRLYRILFRELKMVLSGRLRRYGGRLSSMFRKNAAVMVK